MAEIERTDAYGVPGEHETNQCATVMLDENNQSATAIPDENNQCATAILDETSAESSECSDADETTPWAISERVETTQCTAPDVQEPVHCARSEVDSEDECLDLDAIEEEQLHHSIIGSPATLHHKPINDELFEKVKSWTRDIFKDVTRMTSSGKPGNVLVFGDDAVPLLVSNKQQVMVAASKYGKGRVLLATTETTAQGIADKQGGGALATLQANIKTWLLRKQHGDSSDALKLSDCDDLHTIDKTESIIFSDDFNAVLSRHEEVLRFVAEGGGLLLAFKPWRWYDEHKDTCEVQNVQRAIRQLLKPLGMALGKQKIWGIKRGIDVPQPTARDDVYHTILAPHMAHALDCCCHDDLSNMGDHVTMMNGVLTMAPPYARKVLADRIEAVFQRCYHDIKDCVPTPQNHLTDEDKLGAVAMCNRMALLGHGFRDAPGSSAFPGEIEAHTSLLECVDIEIESHNKKTHATGYYLPAGVQLKVLVLEKSGLDTQWFVRIGAHSDRLYKKTVLKRWPEISMTQQIKGKEFTIQSPFGGLIYFNSPPKQTSIKLQMSNVVEAPFFNLADPQIVDKWQVRRNAPAPWADIQGKYIRLTLLSTAVAVQEVDDLVKVMEMWDKVIASNYDLRGNDVTKQRGQWIVPDVEISAGAMHSGYPIMGRIGMSRDTKNFLLNYNKLTTEGFWGPFHELGHMMQRGWWTFKGTTEVTCNIFALHAVQTVTGIPPQKQTKFTKNFERWVGYLSSDIHFDDLNSKAWTGLGFFVQLVTTFDWDAYKAVFRDYEQAAPEERPQTNQQKIDQWLTRFSNAVKFNIAPIMTLWKIGASKDADKTLHDLKPFLPDDELTRRVPQKVKALEEAYPGLIRKI